MDWLGCATIISEVEFREKKAEILRRL